MGNDSVQFLQRFDDLPLGISGHDVGEGFVGLDNLIRW